MIDFSLRECPFCGNPAEIVEGKPFSFQPNQSTNQIRCSNEWCIAHQLRVRFQPDLSGSVCYARNQWNTRKRKNKVTWSKADENE